MEARLYAVGAGGVLQAGRSALLGARLVLLAPRLTLLVDAVGAAGACGWR